MVEVRWLFGEVLSEDLLETPSKNQGNIAEISLYKDPAKQCDTIRIKDKLTKVCFIVR